VERPPEKGPKPEEERREPGLEEDREKEGEPEREGMEEKEEGEIGEGEEAEAPPEKKKESPLFPLQEVDTDLSPFGADLFSREALPMPLAPTIPAPADYVLGPGDVLLIHYWNTLVDTTFTVDVTTEGRIQIPRGGEVTVGGITMEAARRTIEKKVRDVYKDASVVVTLHALRTIRVFLVGEVKVPGLHPVSALSTVHHGLFAAGGPSERGSYRKIRVLRGDKPVAEIDLYTFLREGRRGGDVRLLAGDTVFVPLAGPRVVVAGKVRRPAVYELLGEKTLEDVLALAGGILPGGHAGGIRLERTVGRHVVLLDVTKAPKEQPIQDGDTVKVFPVYPEPLERVEVSGSVERPGWYQWRRGMKVSDLLTLAGKLLPDAYLGYAEIRRKARVEAEDGVSVGGRKYYPPWQLVRVDLLKVREGDKAADLELSVLDHLRILSLQDVKPELTVEVRGAVEKPGVVEFAKGMRLMDLLSREGQALSPQAHLGRAEIIRRTDEGRGYGFAQGTEKTKARTVTLPVDLGKALGGDPEANLPLKPFDVIKIYLAEEVRPAPTATVLGAVGNPDTFELTSGMRVSDLVFRAGNITAKAYLDSAEIVRRVHDAKAEGTYSLVTLTLDLGKALQGDRKHDLLLENFDRLFVRSTSDYTVEVKMEGEVRYPGTYLMPKGARLADLVKRAGGYTGEAFLPGAFFTRESLREVQEKAKKRFIADQKAKLVDLEEQAQASTTNPQTAAQIRESIRTRRRLLDELAGLPAVGRLAIELFEGAEFRASPQNLVLREGDALVIPKVPVSVTVQGEVFAPGCAYSRSAEGAFSVRWDAENLRWVRNRQSRVVDRGDIVIVPPRRLVIEGTNLTKDIVDILYKIALSAGVLAGIAR
jgi:protein involved in polysaccharide export with SLBB domain